MDYFNNVLTSFLGLEHVSCVAVYVEKLLDFIKNILICVRRWTKVLQVCSNMRVINDRIFIFG